MQFSIYNFLRRSTIIVILSFGAGIFYFIIIQQLGSAEFIRDSLFFSGDAQEYKAYANWISGGDTFIPYRTFFYPLLIFISEMFLGFYGIWILQFGFWLAGSILVFQTTMRLTGKKILAGLSFVIVVSNISLIVYTAHALTEVTTFFFLTLFINLVTGSEKDKLFNLLGLIFILSVLATVKPLFQFIWYIGIILILIFQFKSILLRPILILLLLISASPVIVQKSINKIMNGSYSSSEIADNTIRHYLYKKVKFSVDSDKSQDKTRNFDDLSETDQDSLNHAVSHDGKMRIFTYLISHPITTFSVYCDNIHQNLSSGNPYIDRKKNYSLAKWTENVNNNFIFYIHLIMTLFWIYYVLSNYRKSEPLWNFILISGLLTFYILYSSGISFWAGNRLIIPAIAIWSVLYPLIIYSIFFNRKDIPA